jgi:hypothetical protein
VTYAVEVDADCDCFPEEWLFHHRWGKKPGKVNGETFLKFFFITKNLKKMVKPSL